MAQFGWGAMIRAVAATALVTSAAWLGVGTMRFERGAVTVVRAGLDNQPSASASAAGETLDLISEAQAPAPPPTAGRLAMPVAGINPAELVDTFVQARSEGRVHDAIDIMAPRGTPVIAAAAGKVEKLFNSALGGNTVYMRSPDGRLIYYYAHLDAYAPGLAEGQVLRSGDVLGTVGTTGNADPAAPHLHFAVLQTDPSARWYQPAIAENPYPLLTGRR